MPHVNTIGAGRAISMSKVDTISVSKVQSGSASFRGERRCEISDAGARNRSFVSCSVTNFWLHSSIENYLLDFFGVFATSFGYIH